jgi:ribonuclease H2 subunit A
MPKRKLLCDYSWEVAEVPASCKSSSTKTVAESGNFDGALSINSIAEDGPAVMLGIDEAGRGPVLGSMTYGCAYWRIEDNEEIVKLGYDDSKKISAEVREELFLGIQSNAHRIGWIVVDIPATALSALMLKQSPTSLNHISHECAIAMVERVLSQGVNVQEVYVDTVGDPVHYERKLNARFCDKIKFTVRKKADSLYKVVSAASICAKVLRDRQVKEWDYTDGDKKLAKENHPDVGSGYPGDPKTKDYLSLYFDNLFGFSTFVRHSWSTVKKINDERGVKIEWDEPDDEDSDDNKQANIKSFFQKKGEKKVDLRADFFKMRGMKRVKADLFH